ncbi:MAG TPA: extracellular solute-binding protein [Tepidisphaeraceae bacterium]|nr:extracellular solute-binding protein [Tepidisphaeraceae bacterium]
MRLYTYIALLFAVIATPFLLRTVVIRGRPDADVPKDAGASDVARLVVITPHTQDIRREFGRAFSDWHARKYGRRVLVDFRTPGGSNDIRRQLEHTYRGFQNAGREPVADIDVAWGGGDYFFQVDLQPPGLQILQPMDLEAALLAEVYPQPTLAGVRLYDAPSPFEKLKPSNHKPKWVGVCLSSFGIVYSADVYQSLGLPEPTTWDDLTHERLDGLLALANPTHSGSAAVAYMMVVQRAMADAEEELFARSPQLKALPKAELSNNASYRAAVSAGWHKGMGTLLLIAANARYFTDMANQVPHDVGSGEMAAGISIDFYGRVYEQIVGPRRCRFISPAGATAITPDPVAVLNGVKGERLELAMRFVRFLLSREGQLLWIKRPRTPDGPAERALRRPPVRRDLYADRTDWTDDINPFEEAHGFNQRAEWMTLLTDVRPVWVAAWIDGREALREAYHAVLEVPDAPRRSALLRKLADLPIAMQDVEALRRGRKEREEAKDPALEEWKARQRMEWAARFRAHYRAVETEARQRMKDEG